MTSNRHLAMAGYLTCLFLAAYPAVDALLGFFPPDVGDVAWRYGFGLAMTQPLLTTLVGLCLAVGLALYMEHRVVLSILSIVAGFAAFVLVVLIPVFVLSAFQIRGTLEDYAGLLVEGMAGLKMVTGLIVCVGLTLGAPKATRAPALPSSGGGEPDGSSKASGMVFRAGGRS